MFFSVYLGPARHQSAWQAVLQAHATWLGLSLSVNNRCLTDGRQAAFGSLQHAPGIAVVLREDGDALHLDTSWGQAPHNAIDVRLSRQSEELVVDMPLTTPESCYYAHDARGCVVGNDVRLLLRWAGLQLDERAVLALWQYGAIPAPLTLSTTVQRLPLGHSLRVPPASAAPQLTASLWPPPAHEAPLAEIEPVATLQATLDAFLEQVPQNTALYFSGGVDSGLLAARLAALERRDVHLLHYTFDPDDPDSQLAARMAAHLGMPYQQVVYDPAQLPAVLERLGKDYALPFGDISVIPTNLLVHASLDRQIPAALDGTAADGAFGMGLRYAKWQRLYAVPSMLRQGIAAGYGWAQGWQWHARLERAARVTRQSVQMPLLQAAVMAQNPLEGLAYHIPAAVRRSLTSVIETYLLQPTREWAPIDRFSWLDLQHVCAGQLAAKSFDPLRTHGVVPLYPFLHATLIRLSFALSWEQKCPGGEPKALLKHLLAQQVPASYVYRPKRDFLPPCRDILAQPAMQDFFHDVVLSQDNPLQPFYHAAMLRRCIAHARQGKRQSIGIYKFLWGLIFASGWLRQLSPAGLPDSPRECVPAPEKDA